MGTALQIGENAVDIYFVMDLSSTMRQAKDQLQSAAKQISDQIQNLTTTFRVGFGGFSEKPMRPFSKAKHLYCMDQADCPELRSCKVYCGDKDELKHGKLITYGM